MTNKEITESLRTAQFEGYSYWDSYATNKILLAGMRKHHIAKRHRGTTRTMEYGINTP